MDKHVREVSFGIKDKFGRECGAHYVLSKLRDGDGFFIRFHAMRSGGAYQSSKDYYTKSNIRDEAIAEADAKVEAYRKRCAKQFAVKAIAA